VDLSVGQEAPALELAYQRSGVLAGEQGGGYWLATVEADRRVRVQRFAERDGRPVDAEPVVTGAADARGLGLRATGELGLELFVVRGVGAGVDARLTRARVAGACAAATGQEE
jgi:hypothetical protein